MSDQLSLMARIGRWFSFKRNNALLPVLREVPASPAGQIEPAEKKPRSFFWRPWARRDAAISSLQQGFDSLSGLMASIRDSLERQSRRQDEILGYLAHLPQLLETLPQTQRAHSEALAAIGQQLQQQTQQQARLAEILDRLGEAQGGQQRVLESLAGRVGALCEHDQMVSANLRQVGCAMESMGRSSESSAAVLRQLNEDLGRRNAQIERTMRRQNTRTTVMLVVGMAVSAAAVVALGVVAFLLVRRG